MNIAGDSLTIHHRQSFSTRDRDNDANTSHCAQVYKGGWWYAACHYSNLNGLYLRGHHDSYADGIEWHAWHGYHYSLKKVEMKLRPLWWPTSPANRGITDGTSITLCCMMYLFNL